MKYTIHPPVPEQPYTWPLLFPDRPAPGPGPVYDFLKDKGVFSMAKTMVTPTTPPATFWAMFQDSSIAPFGAIVSEFPCTTASCGPGI